MAFSLMPSQAASCPHAKQQYINGHFCYADKFAILTNGLGIVRDIVFLDDSFNASHPELPIEKKSDSPEEDKTISDSVALKPILTDFLLHTPASIQIPSWEMLLLILPIFMVLSKMTSVFKKL